MTDLVTELLQAADDYEDRARVAGDPTWVHVRVYLARAARLRQRAAWVRELRQRMGSAADMEVYSLLTGPIPAAETAPTERKEP